jgi:hypothetical protein
MPVREMKPQRSSQHAELVDQLTAEWANPNSSNAEPVIYIERDANGKPANVYVVWSRWSDIDRAERSEIIVEAAERRLSPPEALNISIAMGLTAEEGRRLGMQV